MDENFKCPICGGTEHISVPPIETLNDYGPEGLPLIAFSHMDGGTFYPNCSAYVCKKCGHVDIFAPRIIEMLKEPKKD